MLKSNSTLAKVCDYITIICPAILAICGALESSGVVELLGSWQGWAVTILAGASTVASVLYNWATGQYKNKTETAGV